VGEVIRGRRDEVFLATKCGMARNPAGGIMADNHPDTIRRSCDASLRRLGTDRIDLFYLHRIDRAVPLEDSLGAMAELVAAGKVRHVGLSEASAATLRRARALYPVAALQSELSLWTRSASRAALEACRELGLAFVAYSPLGRGFLTGGITDAAALPAGDTRKVFPRFNGDNLPRNLAVLEALRQQARRHGTSLPRLALAWTLAQDPCVLPIPGTKKRRYLDDNAGAMELDLSAADLAALEAAVPEDAVQGERYPATMMGTLNV
jgi:aryl-alcohol dehydrogenase-like predicted oxidoreductase